jgi:cytochrome c
MINAKSKKIRNIFGLAVFFILLLAGSYLFIGSSQTIVGEKNDMLDAADIKNGEAISMSCTVCHTFNEGGPNKTGPNLFGIFGAKHAHLKGYAYSDALLRMKDQTWTVDELYKWLRDPSAYAPGTKMSFSGLLDPQDRLDLIAYLMTLR